MQSSTTNNRISTKNYYSSLSSSSNKNDNSYRSSSFNSTSSSTDNNRIIIRSSKLLISNSRNINYLEQVELKFQHITITITLRHYFNSISSTSKLTLGKKELSVIVITACDSFYYILLVFIVVDVVMMLNLPSGSSTPSPGGANDSSSQIKLLSTETRTITTATIDSRPRDYRAPLNQRSSMFVPSKYTQQVLCHFIILPFLNVILSFLKYKKYNLFEKMFTNIDR